MSGALFRVLLPNGQYTKLYSKEEIRRAFLAKKISKRATVQVGGTEVRISDFLNRVIAPVATQKQKQLAECLGITFKPNINEVEISELIDNALARKAKETDSTVTDSTDSGSAESEETFERMRNEIRAEMLEHGSIPLSQATPDDFQNYFEYERGLHMVILYSPENTFEQLMQAQKTLNAGLPGGTILRICHPDSMTPNALKKLLKIAICNFPDEEADRDKQR